MRAQLRVPLFAFALAVATGCGPRQVEVRTAPTTGAEQSVQVTNNLSQSVNVYVTAGAGNDVFLKQVSSNTVEKLPVRGIAAGSSVVFKAVTVDGSRTYQSRSVTLTGLYVWSVP